MRYYHMLHIKHCNALKKRVDSLKVNAAENCFFVLSLYLRKMRYIFFLDLMSLQKFCFILGVQMSYCLNMIC